VSTIVVVKKDGRAAIAADTLTTWGAAKETAKYIVTHRKIIQIDQSCVAISGPTSAKLAIKDYFSSKAETDLSDVDAIFRTWLGLHRALKDRYFMNPNEDDSDAFESTRVDVLIANPRGIFGVDAHRAVQEFSKYYAYGTGWLYALGAMHFAYEQPNLSAEDVGRIGIEAAAEFDADTGLPITSHTVLLTK
jgi:ATP-dependent HslUV protease subunit HslV